MQLGAIMAKINYNLVTGYESCAADTDKGHYHYTKYYD